MGIAGLKRQKNAEVTESHRRVDHLLDSGNREQRLGLPEFRSFQEGP